MEDLWIGELYDMIREFEDWFGELKFFIRADEGRATGFDNLGLKSWRNGGL
jgi:hypothetical protein